MRFLRQSLIGLLLASLMLALLIYAGQLVMGALQSRMADDRRPPPARERVFADKALRTVLVPGHLQSAPEAATAPAAAPSHA